MLKARARDFTSKYSDGTRGPPPKQSAPRELYHRFRIKPSFLALDLFDNVFRSPILDQLLSMLDPDT